MFYRTRFFAITTVGALLASGCSEYQVSNEIKPDLDTTTTPTTPDTTPPVVPPEGAGAIRGRVCGPEGEGWIAGAFVWVEHSGGRAEAQTDVDGWFLLENVVPGDHEVNVQKGSFTTTFEAVVRDGEVTELPVDSCLEQGDLEIAVLTGHYDTIQEFLDQYNLEYDQYNGKTKAGIEDFLSDRNQMIGYDLIFFNCGIHLGWTGNNALIENIDQFVRQGGSIYASDQAHQIVELPWPAKIDFQGGNDKNSAFVGNSGTVDANVHDEVMQTVLGSEHAEVEFDLASWAAMVTADTSEVDVLISGRYSHGFGNNTNGPLAVRFHPGDGTVIFTSFHNERQLNFDMAQLLQEMILSL